MAELNLLKNSRKKEIKTTTHYIQIINNIIFLIILLTSLSIVLFASKSYLNFKIDQLDKITVMSSEKQDISKINNLISQVATIQKDYVKWSRVLINFFKLIPADSQIKSLTFNKDDKIMTLNGHADSRESFLKLKNNLENSDLIINIDSPISNLLHQTNFDFSLSAELNL